MLGLEVVWFVVAAAVAVAGGGGGGFLVEVVCNLMWVFGDFQKLGGNFGVLKI